MKVEELVVSRRLTLSERAIALALEVSLENDCFSRHGDWLVYSSIFQFFLYWYNLVLTLTNTFMQGIAVHCH